MILSLFKPKFTQSPIFSGDRILFQSIFNIVDENSTWPNPVIITLCGQLYKAKFIVYLQVYSYSSDFFTIFKKINYN